MTLSSLAHTAIALRERSVAEALLELLRPYEGLLFTHDLLRASTGSVASAIGGIESYSAQARVRVESTLQHLAEVSTFLAGVPGVKTLLYLSDSLDLRPGNDLIDFVNVMARAASDAALLIACQQQLPEGQEPLL